MNKEIESFVDFDRNLELEKNSLIRKTLDFFFVPIVNNLPHGFQKFIKKTNTAAELVIKNATNHNALEILYNKGRYFDAKETIGKIFRNIWFNLNNSKAVRNRLKLVKRELKNNLENISKKYKEINIISIASGSSRAVVESINECLFPEDVLLKITFLDKNPHAIEYSKKLCESLDNKNTKLEWINDTVGNFFRNNQNKDFDIVEMVGLLDYFDDKKVLETFCEIYSIIKPEGILITANINHNKEEPFITKIIDWPMIYRTVEELATLVNKAGFEYNKMKAFYEPLKIHGIVVAKK